MKKETDNSSIPSGGYIYIDYGDGDVREFHFKDTLNGLNELPCRPAKYGLYHETYCNDGSIVDRLARVVWHDVREVSYASKISQECRTAGQEFWKEWLHINTEHSLIGGFDPTDIFRKMRRWVAASDLGFTEKTILVDMFDYFINNGAFTLTEGI